MLLGRRLRRSLGTALAGLVVLALLMVAARRITERPSTPPDAAAAHTVGVARDDDGLRLSLSVPRGPYFRDELLPVTLTLTNNSGRPIPYAVTYLLGGCQTSPLDVTITGGGHYLNPVAITFSPSCPAPRQPFTMLRAGKSLRARILLGLPTSGPLILTGQAFFPPNARVISPGLLAPTARLDLLRHLFRGLFRSSHAPFASGWPNLTIWVRPHAPADRMLRLVRRGHVVYAQGYGHMVPPLVVEQLAADVEPQATCYSGGTPWAPLASDALQEATCPDSGEHQKWQVLVGAPGYAIAGAVYCFGAAALAPHGPEWHHPALRIRQRHASRAAEGRETQDEPGIPRRGDLQLQAVARHNRATEGMTPAECGQIQRDAHRLAVHEPQHRRVGG